MTRSAIALSMLLLTSTTAPTLYSQPPVKKAQKASRFTKCEIQDILPEDRRHIDLGDGYSGPRLFDAWSLLPETTMLLPVPNTFNVMEQVKRVAAWEYKASPDRDMYKQEYMALIKDPEKWISFISNNLESLINWSLFQHRLAANNADYEGMVASERICNLATGYLTSGLYWRISVDSARAAQAIKEQKAKS